MQLTLDHKHQSNQEPFPHNVQSLKLSLKQSKLTKNIPQSSTPIQPQYVFFNEQIQQQPSSYNFHIHDLEEIHKDTSNLLPLSVIEAIEQRKKFSEERVYQAIVHTSYDFVGIHLRDFKLGMKSELQTMFQGIHDSVEAGIWDGRYEIGKKNNYLTINRKEDQLVAHITEELVRKNIDSFRQELDQSQSANDVLNVSFTHRAKSEVHKTKRAQQFIKKMQEEQVRHQQFVNRKKQERLQYEVKSMQQQNIRKEMLKQEKQGLIRKRMEKHNELMSIEKQHKKKIHSDYLKFLSNTKEPLFKQMQGNFQKQQIERQKQTFKKMKRLMDERRPISFQDINEHMERYDQLLYENQQYRKQKKELKEHQMEIIASKKPYRSKFYSLVVQGDSPTIGEKQLKTSLLKKQTDFSEHVKKNFIPKTDEKKQQELEQLIKRISNQKKHVYHSRKYIEQGNKNLQKLHLLIGELRAKNKLKENIGLQSIMETNPLSKKYKNYLVQAKQSRLEKDGDEISIDYDQTINQGDHELVKMRAMIKQTKAKQKDKYLNSAMATLDFQSHMKGKKTVEEDFMEAAKAKMAILKNYNIAKQSQTLH